MMQRFETRGLAQYAYLIASEGFAVVIDPIRDIAPILDFAQSHKLTISHVVETHIHADFASGATALVAATGAELALSAYDEGERYEYAMAHRALHTGDAIQIGKLRLEALHTPGHTPEHVSFVLFEGESPTAIFSGDFLFVGSLGRPDLLGEDASRELARSLYVSVHERIAALPGKVRVYPGHGAGSFCGAGMGDAAESTLAAERATNPLFQLDEAAFVASILASAPPLPAYYPRMKQFNADGPPLVAFEAGGRALTFAEVAALASDPGTVLLDLREARAFAAAHVPGSLAIGLGGNISLWAGWLLDSERPVVLIGAGDDSDVRRGGLALRNVGLDRVAGHLAGGFPAWPAGGGVVATTALVPPAGIAKGAHIVDVRNRSEFEHGHMPEAVHIPLGDLPGRLDELPVSDSLTLVCEGGYRAAIAASLLERRGFTGMRVLDGGMEAWQRHLSAV